MTPPNYSAMSPRATDLILRFLLWLPPIALMGLIFHLSSMTLDELSEQGLALQLWDKTQHFLAYLVLSFLLAQALTGRLNTPPSWSAAALAFALAAMFGISDEIHQYFVPTRQMDLADWLADCVGASVVFLWWFFGSRGNGKQVYRST